MPRDQGEQGSLCPGQILLWRKGIQCCGFQQLARCIHDSQLDPGPNARIKADRNFGPCRSGQQKILEIAAEDPDRLVMSAFAQLGQQVDIHRIRQSHPPGPAGDLPKPFIPRLFAQFADGLRHDTFGARCATVRIGRDVDGHHFFLGGPQDGKCAMRGDIGPFLAVIEVIGKFRPGLFLTVHDLCRNKCLGPHEIAQRTQQSGILGQFLDQNVTRSVQSRLHIGDGFGNVALRQFLRFGAAIFLNGAQQWFQPVLTGDHRLGAALGLERQVDILKRCLGFRRGDAACQFVGQLVLFADRFKDRFASGLQLTQIGNPFGQDPQLAVIQPTRHLLAVSRDKGDRRAAIKQFHSGIDLRGAGIDLGRDDAGDTFG